MAQSYGGAELNQGFSHLGQGIAAAIQREHKRRENIRTIQGFVDAARRLQRPDPNGALDPKTGQVKMVPFFKDDQLAPIQHQLDINNAASAAAQATALGILTKGLGMKVDAANQSRALMGQGPTTVQQGGVTYRLNQTGQGTYNWVPVGVSPRNAQGFTPHEQANFDRLDAQQKTKNLAAFNNQLNAALKANRLTQQQINDPTQVQYGNMTADPQTQVQQFTPIDPRLSNENATAVRVGYRPDNRVFNPQTGQWSGDAGFPGVVMSSDNYKKWQQTIAANKWLQSNPDDPNASGVARRLASDLGFPMGVAAKGGAAPEAQEQNAEPPADQTEPAQQPEDEEQ